MARDDTGLMRGGAIALGVGLLILWLAGLAYHATRWLTWLDGVAALVAFTAAASDGREGRTTQWLSGAIAAGLFVLWIVGLSVNASRALSWWNFAFACGFLLLAVTAGSMRGIRELHPRTA